MISFFLLVDSKPAFIVTICIRYKKKERGNLLNKHFARVNPGYPPLLMVEKRLGKDKEYFEIER